MTSKLIGIATSATIAIAALTSTASATPLSAFGGAGQQIRTAGDFVVEVGARKNHVRRHIRHHLRHHHGHGHRNGFYFGYSGNCWRLYKVVTDHAVFWKKVWICG